MPDAPEKRKRKPSRVLSSPPRPIRDLKLTPVQMLGVILKIVLRDKITNDEVDKICATYYEAITKWFPMVP